MDIKEALTFDGLKYFYTKYIKPLKTGAFSTVVNNATTTVANTVLDGRMGKTLADKDTSLQSQINTLNSSLGKEISQTIYRKPGGDIYCYARKKNGFVVINGYSYGSLTIPNGQYYPLTTLPTEYRPVELYHFSVQAIGSNEQMLGVVRTDGIIQFYTNTQMGYWGYTFMFPVTN